MRCSSFYPGKLKIRLAIFLVALFFFNTTAAQRVLNKQETVIVEEAYAELNKAISDPALAQSERLRLVERSAKTLKEYGQAPAFPEGDIPLKKLMQYNFDEASNQYNDVNELRNKLNTMQLEAKMKFINAVQIEVVEEQIKLLIPGEEEFEFSKDLVGTAFSWNIVEGFNEGKVDDAKVLADLFKKAAEANKLAGQLDELFKDHQFNMQQLHRDLKMVNPLEAQLRKKYELTEASTFTLKGLEGATITEDKTIGLPKSNSYLLDPYLFGTWLNMDNNKKKSGWQFNNDGTALQYVRDKKYPGWTWEVRGGMLYIIGGNKKSEDYVYKFENGDLYIEVTFLGKQVWSAPMSKQ